MLANFVSIFSPNSCLSNFRCKKILQSLWKWFVNVAGNTKQPATSFPSSTMLILAIGITHVSKALFSYIIDHLGGKKEEEKKGLNCFCAPLGMRCHIVRDMRGGQNGVWGGVVKKKEASALSKGQCWCPLWHHLGTHRKLQTKRASSINLQVRAVYRQVVGILFLRETAADS